MRRFFFEGEVKFEIMSDNWIVQNMQNVLNTWNEKLSEIWFLLTEEPKNFRGGDIWNVILNIHGALKAIGIALLVLFFFAGVVKESATFSETKRPEYVLKLFIRFAIAKGIVTYGLELMTAIFDILQGVVNIIMKTSGITSAENILLPDTMISVIEECGFFESIPLWAVTIIGSLIITVLSFIIIMTVYGRFFKLYLYAAIAPIPLATAAGAPTQHICISFLKSYAAVCMEGVIIVLACVIFSLFAASPPILDTEAAPTAMVWSYLGELIFNMLILVGTIKLSDHVVREMMGL